MERQMEKDKRRDDRYVSSNAGREVEHECLISTGGALTVEVKLFMFCLVQRHNVI